MSTHISPSRAEPDAIAVGRVVSVGIGALVIFGISILAVWFAYRGLGGTEVQNPARVPAAVRQQEVGIVFQIPFWQTQATPAREAASRWLHSYGWVDRPSGTIHIPIDRAMQLLMEEQTTR